ncbi:anion transporter [Natrialba aegyptia DSM 13077]|uniref:Anion transporter n=1 Tax=Natrialba aegyptia DSM 13077 TaxID=1227491 RepID=M0AYY6_9EURY|nr:anion transporter [Natrialba aegyptia DSM 13077]
MITLVALLWLPMARCIDLGLLPTEFAEAWSGYLHSIRQSLAMTGRSQTLGIGAPLDWGPRQR